MRGFLGVLFSALVILGSDLALGESYPLNLAQREHLKKYIPRTFYKLDAQRPVHIVALGDSVTWMYTRDGDNGNWLHSYVGDFGSRLARQFFYPGGVKALNPEKGNPSKLKNHLGKEIFIENLSIPGRCALDAIQRVTSDAFVNDPDLVIIEFGINDAVRGHSIDTYRKSLQATINVCRQRGVDVILLGPSITRLSPGPTGWGLTRTFATVAQEVARENEVLFVDFGPVLASVGGGVPSGVEAEAAVQTMSDRLNRIFEFDPMPDPPEVVHPNRETHELMGRTLFRQVMSPERDESDFSVSGRAAFNGNESIKVTLLLKNQSEKPRKGYLGALAMGRILIPKDPYRSFELEPNETKEIELEYERVFVADIRGGRVAMPIAEANLRLSYFIVDEDKSRLIDVVTRLQPVSVIWSKREFREVEDELKFEWQFVSGERSVVQGEYRIGMGEGAVSKWVKFSVDPLASKKFQATFPFSPPEGAARFKTAVFVEVRSQGQMITFPRELEAIRDVTLGQRVALSRYSGYGVESGLPKVGAGKLNQGDSGVVMRVDADEKFVYLTFDFEELSFATIADGPSLMADIAIDARPIAQVGTFGFMDKVRIKAGSQDGLVPVDRLQLGVFGNGYDLVLLPEGIRAELKTPRAGARRLEVQIPVSYLYRYDGKVGSPEAVMGINANVSLANLDADGKSQMGAEMRFVHASPLGGPEQSVYYRDPRGAGVLRLTTSPVSTWTAHLY